MSDKKIRVLIVDDEPLGREIVRAMLEHETEIEIVLECENGKQAIDAINTLRPDLMFLDIQMPQINGFDVIKAVGESKLPYIIFITAYDHYAIKAFDVNALDYVLKPIDPDRFAQSISKALKVIKNKSESEFNQRILALFDSQKPSDTYLERISVKSDGKIFLLRTSEIEWIIAEGNYVSVHISKRSYLLRITISLLETKLQPNKFHRINRSTIVNIDFIKELVPMFRGEYQVILQDGTSLKLSSRFRDNLVKFLGGLF